MENVALRNLYETRNNRLFRFPIIYKYIIYSASLLVNVAKYLTHPYLQSIIYAQRYQLFDIVIVWDSTLLFLKKIPKQRKWMRPKDLCLNNVGKSIITYKISRMVPRESDESFEKLSENEMSKNLYHQLPFILYTMDKTASLIIKKSST